VSFCPTIGEGYVVRNTEMITLSFHKRYSKLEGYAFEEITLIEVIVFCNLMCNNSAYTWWHASVLSSVQISLIRYGFHSNKLADNKQVPS